MAGPGIGDCNELEKILPPDYHSLLTPQETQQAIFHVKRYIEDNLCNWDRLATEKWLSA